MTKKICVLFTFLFTRFLNADIVEATFWQRKIEPEKMQYVLTCSDLHSVYIEGHRQAVDLVKFCSAATSGHLLYEDINDLDLVAQDVKEFDEEHDFKGKLVGEFHSMYQAYKEHKKLASKEGSSDLLYILKCVADTYGVLSSNIDFRLGLTPDAPNFPFSRKCASDLLRWRMNHWINKLMEREVSSLTSQCSQRCIEQFKPFLQEVVRVMKLHSLEYKELPQYYFNLLLDDCNEFDAKVFLPAIKEDNLSIHKSLNQIIKMLKAGNRSEEVKAALLSELEYAFYLAMTDIVDVVILQELDQRQVQNCNNDLLAVCVGQAHASSINTFLPELGYKQVADWRKEGTQTFGAFCANQLKTMQKNEKNSLFISFVDFIKGLFLSTFGWMGRI